MSKPLIDAPKGSPKSLSGLLPFLKPYRLRIALALLFLLLAAGATLVFPLALRELIDGGLTAGGALAGHFGQLFLVAVALGLFSAGRFYLVSWLGERVTADLRSAVYGHVLEQSPEFFERTPSGEVLCHELQRVHRPAESSKRTIQEPLRGRHPVHRPRRPRRRSEEIVCSCLKECALVQKFNHPPRPRARPARPRHRHAACAPGRPGAARRAGRWHR